MLTKALITASSIAVIVSVPPVLCPTIRQGVALLAVGAAGLLWRRRTLLHLVRCITPASWCGLALVTVTLLSGLPVLAELCIIYGATLVTASLNRAREARRREQMLDEITSAVDGEGAPPPHAQYLSAQD